MNSRTIVPLAAGAVALAIAAYVLWPAGDAPAAASRRDPGPAMARTRPTAPPVPGRDVPTPVPMPEAPPNSKARLAVIYQAARAAGEAKPGEKAFRASVDAFVKYNMAFAEQQAADEGITVDEVRELTYLGQLAQQTTRWPDVQEILGHDLTEDQRRAADQHMHDTNAKFKQDMRELVAGGADPDERWQLIYATEQRYLDKYFELTGMTPEMLDDLLAGDLSRTGAPAATTPPEDITPAPPPAPVGPRPERTPR